MNSISPAQLLTTRPGQVTQAKHAVLTATNLVTIAETERKLCRKSFTQPINHISDLWHIGQTTGVTHFWIMPDTPIDQAGYNFLSKREGYNVFVPLADVAEKPRGARCWKEQTEGGTHQIFVFYPASEPFSWAVNHPLDILSCVDYLTQVLSLDIQWSPQSIGEAYLRRQYESTKRLQAYLRDCTIDQKALPFRKAAPEIMFRRAISDDMLGLYFHMYDKNAAHPSAASSMFTGIGDPVHITGDIQPTKPGIYRVSIHNTGESIFNGRTLPMIIDSEWVTLDVLKYARKQGYSVEIHEAHIFEQSYRLFDEWAANLWKARQALKDAQHFPYAPGRMNAYSSLKDIMNRTISSLHKNWWADMVGLARVARLANLEKFAQGGNYPVLVYYDDMGFISSDPNPKTAVAGILDRADKMGGYKHKYTLEVTQELQRDCNQCKKPGQMIAYLKKTAQEKGLI